MSNVQSFLADQYEMELSQFRAALSNVSDFEHAQPGHSAAWHAAHVAEWLRFFVLQDLSASYAALGWEDSAWVGQYTGTPRVAVSAGREAIMAELERLGSEVLAHLRGLKDEELNAVLVSPAAPGGTRPRLIGLGLHLRHIAYHRGQVRLAAKG
ncbi:DinB family protein [Deinococcus sp.]|uniref:DinB family protein n=1 Tax=Deinococcus sp. TaxID=47478 RepID=UPI0025EFDE9A|nr:DinB family protein [Deinococcus sp.]